MYARQTIHQSTMDLQTRPPSRPVGRVVCPPYRTKLLYVFVDSMQSSGEKTVDAIELAGEMGRLDAQRELTRKLCARGVPTRSQLSRILRGVCRRTDVLYLEFLVREGVVTKEILLRGAVDEWVPAAYHGSYLRALVRTPHSSGVNRDVIGALVKVLGMSELEDVRDHQDLERFLQEDSRARCETSDAAESARLAYDLLDFRRRCVIL